LKCTPEAIILRGDGASSIRIVKGDDATISIKKIVVSAGQNYATPCLNFDEIESVGAKDSINDFLVLLHLDTFLSPSYDPRWLGNAFVYEGAARDSLRGGCPEGVAKIPADNQKRNLSLPINVPTPFATVTLQDEKDKVITFQIPLRQRTWCVDTGVLISWAKVSRESVRTQVVANTNQVQVVQHDVSREPDYNTGVLVTAFPNNYPNLGVSLGIGSGLESKPAWLGGGSFRFLSEDKSSVATFTLGRAWMPVKVFNVQVGDVLDPGDSRLAGEVKYKSVTFWGLQLGFAIKGL